MKLLNLCFFALLFTITIALTGTNTSYSGIPSIVPTNMTVTAQSMYTLSTYLPLNLNASSYFQLDFTGSQITATNGALNCSYNYNGTSGTISNCSCNNNICYIVLANNFSMNNNLMLNFGNLNNPFYISPQLITIGIQINSTRYALVNTTISSLLYSNLPIIINSINQSDYSVGTSNVNYYLNFSLSNYVPPNPQLQIILPSEISLNYNSYTMNFYNTQQTSQASFITTGTQTSLTFFITFSQNLNISGWIGLNISGFVNPQFIGNSSSFIIIIKTSCMATGSGCSVANLTNGLYASANSAGDLPVLALTSNNNFLINTKTNVSINLQLSAPIPVNGQLNILLPTGIVPIMPIICNNVSGYILTNGINPICAYNATSNTINTVNFAYPYLASASSAVISIGIVNPPDTSNYIFFFQSYDQYGRVIGSTRNGFAYSCNPGTLNYTITRNDSTVNAYLKLFVNLTFANNLTPNGNIQLLIPTEIANTTAISPMCLTGTTSLNCVTSISTQDNSMYNITFVPLCPQGCVSNQSFSFSIINLVNPSYINNLANPITIQTTNQYFTGIIDSNITFIQNLGLTMFTSNIPTIQITGSNVVGTQLTISLNFTISAYYQYHDGFITINLPQNSTFVYGTPSAYVILSNGQNIPITLLYTLYDQNMQSISSLTISQACTLTVCGSVLTIGITGISYSYSTKSYSPYNFTIYTVGGDPISNGSITYPQITPIVKQSQLFLSASNLITGSLSTYNISFVPTIPIDSLQNGGYILVNLPSQLNYPSSCSISTNLSLTFTLLCKIQGNIINVSYSNGVPQMLQKVLITITLANVVNPFSSAPLNYKVVSYFNNAPSESFSSNFVIPNNAVGTATSSKTNNTYNSSSSISILATFNFNVTTQDIISIYVPLGLFIFINNVLYANSFQTSAAIVSNSTYQTISFTPLSSTNFLNITLAISNPTSTMQFNSIIITTFRNGYSSQTMSFLVAPCLPLYLPATITTSNQFTGDFTNLTLTFSHNINSINLKIVLPNSGWSYGSANLTSTTALTNNSLIALSTTSSTTIVLYNLTNKVDISPINDNLILIGLDNQNNPVETISYNISSLVASVPKVISMTGIRSSSNSLSKVVLNISISNFNVQTNLTVINIDLPINQFSIANANGGISCTFATSTNLSSLQQACSIASITSDSVKTRIQTNYPCSVNSCTKAAFSLIINGVSNLYPDVSNTNVSFYQNEYPSQTSSFVITPNIIAPQLNNPTILFDSIMVTQNNTVSISFSSPLAILPNSTISVSIGDLVFIKNKDCQYSIGGMNYIGCGFTQSTNGYVTLAQLNTLGINMIAANTMIQIQLFMINAYAAFNISTAVIKISILSSNFEIASYSTTMGVLLNAISFTPATISTAQITRNTTNVGSLVNIGISISIPVNFYYNTVFNLMISKDQVNISIINLSNLVCTNCVATYSSQDDSYYYYNIQQTTCQTLICFSQIIVFNISGLTNNMYVKFQPNSFMLLLNYNGSVVCNPISLNVIGLSASQATINASRQSNIPLAPTNLNIMFTLSQPINTSVLINLVPNSYIIYGGIINISLVGSNTSIGFINQISNGYLSSCLISLTQLPANLTLSFQIVNSPLVTIGGSLFNVSIYNTSLLFYSNSLTSISNQIVPYTSNVTLTRSVTTLASLYSLNINYKLPVLNLNGYTLTIPNLLGEVCSVVCSSSSNGYTSFLLSLNSATLVLNNLTNPSDLNEFSLNVTIASNLYIAYSGSILITPALTPIYFVSQILSSNTTANCLNNLTINNLPSSGSSLNLSFPIAVFINISSIYYNGMIISNWTQTINSTNHFVQINGIQLQGSSLILTVNNYPAVSNINAIVNISSRLPYSIGSAVIAFNLTPSILTTNLVSTSYKVDQISNYTVNINLVNVISASYVDINFPFTVANISLTNSNYIKLNLTSIRITQFSNTVIKLLVYNVTNPSNNQPLTYFLNQIYNATGSLVATGNSSIQMTQLGIITVTSSSRNSSKLNAPISIIMNISFQNIGRLLSFTFSASQIYANNNTAIICRDLVHNTTLNCVTNNNILQVNVTSDWSGNVSVQVDGYFNNKYNKISTTSDSINVHLFDNKNFLVGQSSGQLLLQPQATTGNISISNYIQSSTVIFNQTNLSFAFELQDALTANSVFIIQQNNSYISTSNMKCYINNILEKCYVNNNQTIINNSNYSLLNGTISIISGLYNGMAPGVIYIRTNDLSHSADIDTVYLNNPYSYSPFNLAFRVILEMNAVGTQNFKILVDNSLPYVNSGNYILNLSITNTNLVSSNITIDSLYVATVSTNNNQNLASASMNTNQFNGILLENVEFVQSGVSVFSLQLIYKNVVIASGSNNLTILPAPTTTCSNTNCDICSQTSNGQYCLSCREGQVQINGNCVSSCPDKMYVATTSCQPCSINCNTCYDAYSNNCLSCNAPLIDNSGTCTQAINCRNGDIVSNYCIGSLSQCTKGCSSCSPSGFCYQCQSGYRGIGTCYPISLLPATFFTYFIIPSLLLFLVGTVYSIVGLHGFTSFLGMAIFTLSITEIFCNIFLIPLMNSLFLSIWICSLLILRIVLSIVSYEGYFKTYIYKDEQLIAKDLSWKDKMISLFAHVINVDSYMLYLSKIGNPVMERSMPFNKGIKIFNIVNMLIRFGLMFSCVYLLSSRQPGDLSIISLICILTQIIVIISHILANNYLFSKLMGCMNAILRRT